HALGGPFLHVVKDESFNPAISPPSRCRSSRFRASDTVTTGGRPMRIRVSLLALLPIAIVIATPPAWCAIVTDVTVFTNRSNSGSNITSPSFSTNSAAELLLAFVASDAKSPGMSVTNVTGAGLTWALVRRTNVQLGTAEIWRAFAPTKLSNVTVRANLSQ